MLDRLATVHSQCPDVSQSIGIPYDGSSVLNVSAALLSPFCPETHLRTTDEDGPRRARSHAGDDILVTAQTSVKDHFDVTAREARAADSVSPNGERACRIGSNKHVGTSEHGLDDRCAFGHINELQCQ